MQNSLPEEEQIKTIPARIVPQDLSPQDCLLLSCNLNLKNEAALAMTTAGMSKAINNLLEGGVSALQISEGLGGGSKIPIGSVGHYSMIYKRFVRSNCFELLEYLCDLQPPNESPFKKHVLILPITKSVPEYAMRGWLLKTATELIKNFVPPKDLQNPTFQTPQQLEEELSKAAADEEVVCVSDGQEDAEELEKEIKAGSKKGKPKAKKKEWMLQHMIQNMADWRNREKKHQEVQKLKEKHRGEFVEADVDLLEERIYKGSLDKFSIEDKEFKVALNKAFKKVKEKKVEVAVLKKVQDSEGEDEEEGEQSGQLSKKRVSKTSKPGDVMNDDSALTQNMSIECPLGFRTGDCRNEFTRSFLSWSGDLKAQLCLCDPPWGIRAAAYDREWNAEGWTAFARQVTDCMNDDGVILLFLPHQLYTPAATAFQCFNWHSFHHKFVWVHKPNSKAFMFNAEPFSAHNDIFAFVKSKNFKVKIDKDLEISLGFGGGTNLYHNVIVTMPTKVYRSKPKGAADDDDDEGAAAAGDLEQEAKNALQRFRIEQKPLQLLQMFIRRYAPGENDIIIDPTFGTGSTGIATYMNACDSRIGRRFFFGMDSDPKALVVANTWLMEVQRKLEKKGAPSPGKTVRSPAALEFDDQELASAGLVEGENSPRIPRARVSSKRNILVLDEASGPGGRSDQDVDDNQVGKGGRNKKSRSSIAAPVVPSGISAQSMIGRTRPIPQQSPVVKEKEKLTKRKMMKECFDEDIENSESEKEEALRWAREVGFKNPISALQRLPMSREKAEALRKARQAAFQKAAADARGARLAEQERKRLEDQCSTCKKQLRINGDEIICMCCKKRFHDNNKCSEHLTPDAVFAMCKKCLASNCRRCQKPFGEKTVQCNLCEKNFCSSTHCIRQMMFAGELGDYCFNCFLEGADEPVPRPEKSETAENEDDYFKSGCSDESGYSDEDKAKPDSEEESGSDSDAAEHEAEERQATPAAIVTPSTGLPSAAQTAAFPTPTLLPDDDDGDDLPSAAQTAAFSTPTLLPDDDDGEDVSRAKAMGASTPDSKTTPPPSSGRDRRSPSPGQGNPAVTASTLASKTTPPPSSGRDRRTPSPGQGNPAVTASTPASKTTPPPFGRDRRSPSASSVRSATSASTVRSATKTPTYLSEDSENSSDDDGGVKKISGKVQVPEVFSGSRPVRWAAAGTPLTSIAEAEEEIAEAEEELAEVSASKKRKANTGTVGPPPLKKSHKKKRKPGDEREGSRSSSRLKRSKGNL